MRAVCITCDVNDDRFLVTEKHLSDHGIKVCPFIGFNNRLAGLTTEHTYDVDHPGTGYRISGPVIGIGMSHWMVWRAMQLWDDDSILIFEDDARFASEGPERLKAALANIPSDWDVLYTGSCCSASKPKHKICGEIYAVHWPLCTHSYAITKKAAAVMLDRHDKVWAPVDISMVMDCYQKTSMKVYTVLPRIFDQHATNIGA